MARFYCNSRNISKNKISVNDPALLHHCRDVLRLQKNDPLMIFDERSSVYQTRIVSLGPREMILEITKTFESAAACHATQELTVACAMPKKSKFDDIVDKLTQLGVECIIPLTTERTVVRIDPKKAHLKRLRWEKIALQASQQSKRIALPRIEPVTDFKTLLGASEDYAYKLLPTLLHERKTINEVFHMRPLGRVLVCIGPEGDFSDKEITGALHAGFIAITLGNLVLRVETAAVAVAAIIKSYEDR